MKRFLKPLLAILLFVICQYICVYGLCLAKLLLHPELRESVKAEKIGVDELLSSFTSEDYSAILIICGVLVIVIACFAKMLNNIIVVNPSGVKWGWAFE